MFYWMFCVLILLVDRFTELRVVINYLDLPTVDVVKYLSRFFSQLDHLPGLYLHFKLCNDSTKLICLVNAKSTDRLPS